MLVFGGVYRWSIEDWLVVSNIVYFHPYLRKWWKLTHIFQMGWNHQPDRGWSANKDVCMFLFCLQKKRNGLIQKGGGGFKFSSLLGEMIPIWLIFFNWVWNHQLEKVRITAISNCYLSKDQLFDAFGIQLSFGVQGATDWYHGGALEVIDVLLPAFKIWYMQI